MHAPHMISQLSHKLLRWMMWAWHLPRRRVIIWLDHQLRMMRRSPRHTLQVIHWLKEGLPGCQRRG